MNTTAFRLSSKAAAIAGAFATTVATTFTTGSALAHTGHGHDGFTAFTGLLHALREPEHVAAIALGIVVTGVLAPLVLRGVQRVVAVLRRALELRRAATE